MGENSSIIKDIGIDFFYNLAIKEGEGLGTAYEYLVKDNLIKRLLKRIGNPKDILIAGLPEKYGYELNSLFLANSYGCKIDIIDDREAVIKDLDSILQDLTQDNLLMRDNIKIQRIKDLSNFNTDKNYKLAFSSAVFQRFQDKSRANYLKRLCEKAKYIILFVPNKGNKAHPKITGLNSLSIVELREYCKRSEHSIVILEAGTIDLPPFPPGIKISPKTKGIIKNTIFKKNILIKFLEIWVNIEQILPKIIKERFSHIGYLILEVADERSY